MIKLRRFISILLIVAMVLPFVTQLRAEDLLENPEILSELIEENSDIEDVDSLNEEELNKDKEEGLQEELSENETNIIEEVNSNNIQLYSNNDDNTEVAEKRIAVVLLLDVSKSMEFNQGKPFLAMKEAAKEFCKTILEKNPSTTISLIEQFKDSAPVSFEGGRYWSSDINELKREIDSFQYGYGTGIESAFREADKLLKKIDADQKVIINMSDGAPNYGKTIDDGELFSAKEIKKVSGEDKTFMRIANGTYDYIKTLTDYQIFSIGFFHADPDKNNNATEIGTKLMENAHNSGYYDATNEDELLEAYKKIVDVVTTPVTMEVFHTPNKDIWSYNILVKLKNKYKQGVIENGSLILRIKEGNAFKEISRISIMEFKDEITEHFKIYADKNLYKNGGRLEYEVIFNNNQVGRFTVSSYIPIINNTNNFDFKKDSYSFDNFSNNFILTDNDLEAMYKKIDVVDRMNIQFKVRDMRKDNSNSNNSVAHCHGMAVTSLLNHGKIIGSETFGYGKSRILRHVNKTAETKRIIQYYHIQQYLKSVKDYWAETRERFLSNPREIFNSLKENIENAKNKGTLLPLVSFNWRKKNMI